jgi:hypothetical protein
LAKKRYRLVEREELLTVPRISPESKSAAINRAQGKAPAPPAHLDVASKKIWRLITHSKPVDYFDPVQRHFLKVM